MFQFPLFQNLTELDGDKVDRYSDTTYSEVKGLGYDEASKKLGLVISQGGADTVIPFNSGSPMAFIMFAYAPSTTNNTWIAYGNSDGTYDSGNGFSIGLNCEFVSTITGSGGSSVKVTLSKDGYYAHTSGYGKYAIQQFTAGTQITIDESANNGGAIVFIHD